MDAAFLPTIVGDLDRTFPENEMVLAIEGDGEWLAFPLHDAAGKAESCPRRWGDVRLSFSPDRGSTDSRWGPMSPRPAEEP